MKQIPHERRQALQARIATDVDRYKKMGNDQRPYATSGVLAKLEKLVDEGGLNESWLASDELVMEWVKAYALMKDDEDAVHRQRVLARKSQRKSKELPHVPI